MHRRHLECALALLLALPAFAYCADPAAGVVDVEVLRRKQEHQQRARDLARELVSSILDIQLQQLSENGLEHLPLYRDISQMRTHLDGLIEAEMADVVNLLLKAQDQLPAKREATFVEARKKTREVVVRLSIERQNLLRRLKTAEMAAQVKRLISLQTIVANATGSLPAQASSRQEGALVTIIQDERDVQALFGRLLEMLREVRGWGGEVGQGAAEGLAILRTAGVDEQLGEAIAELEMAEFNNASNNEAAVLKGLRLLLDKIEETQGLVSTDRELALERVRELAQQQQRLHDETQASKLDEPTIDKLIERQAAIQQEIGRLPEVLGRVPAALPAVAAARRAASDASARIFDAKRDEALAQQKQVATQLANVEQQLLAAALRPDVAESAAQLEKLAEVLAKAQQQIEKAQALTAKAQPKSSEQLARDAASHLTRAADELSQIKPDAPLPESVKLAIEEATDQTRRAADGADKQDARPQQSKEALAEARRAQQHAQSEVAAALADARRNSPAARYQELSKAAEALDRAAGAQRDVAAQAAKAAEGLTPDAARELANRETAVGQVASKVARAIGQSVPEAARQLEQAQSMVDEARKGFESHAAADKKPPAAGMAQQGEKAEKAVAPLAAAAEQLRSAAAKAAGQLDAESRRQLAQLEPVRDAVAQASMSTPPADETTGKLVEAEKKVRSALEAQQRATQHDSENLGKQQQPNQSTGELQLQITAAIEEAQQLVRPLAAEAGKPVGEALAASKAAERQLRAREQQAARKSQEQAEAALKLSLNLLHNAVKERTQREAAELGRAAAKAEMLAEEAAPLDPAAVLALQAAEKNSRQQAAAADPAQVPAAQKQLVQDLQRAAASLAAREDRIRHAQAMAAPLAKAAENQKLAGAEILAARQALAAGQTPAKPHPQQQPASPTAQLEKAIERYARASDAAQHAAAEARDSSGIADPQLLDALAAAAKLQPAARPSDSSAKPASSAAPAKSSTNESAAGQLPAADTARVMAGSEALSQLQAAAQAAQPAQAQAGQKASAAKPSSASASPRDSQQAAAEAAHATAASAEGNQAGRESGATGEDARSGERNFREEPWVAKLPPELRAAIRAQSQRRPPAAYEERLRRYFENVE